MFAAFSGFTLPAHGQQVDGFISVVCHGKSVSLAGSWRIEKSFVAAKIATILRYLQFPFARWCGLAVQITLFNQVINVCNGFTQGKGGLVFVQRLREKL